MHYNILKKLFTSFPFFCPLRAQQPTPVIVRIECSLAYKDKLVCDGIVWRFLLLLDPVYKTK